MRRHGADGHAGDFRRADKRLGPVAARAIDTLSVYGAGNRAADFDEGAKSDAGIATGLVDYVAFGAAVRFYVPARFDACGYASDMVSDARDAFHGDHSRHSVARRNYIGSAERGHYACSDGIVLLVLSALRFRKKLA